MSINSKLMHLVIVSFMLLVLSTHSKARLCDRSDNSVKLTNDCNDSNSCPTWFSCNAVKKKCQCENGHDVILCDNSRMLSAVPTCRCVTVDSNTGDTFAGACVYSCGGLEHHTYRLLPQSLNATNFQYAIRFTGLGCCVVTVKMVKNLQFFCDYCTL